MTHAVYLTAEARVAHKKEAQYIEKLGAYSRVAIGQRCRLSGRW